MSRTTVLAPRGAAAQETEARGGDGAPAADVFVAFGITGDLAKVMTFRSLYRLERRGLLQCPIVGVAADDWDADRLRAHARESIAGTGEEVDDVVFARFAARLSYVSGDFGDPATYERVRDAVGDAVAPVFYLEIPPFLFGRVVEGLSGAGLTDRARVVVEKPFGHDRASAMALNAQLRAHLREDQLYRIDHFLGKMGLREVLYLRFANTLLEPVWNRHHVAAVELTMAEEFGVEDRGHFYDPVGALRDVVVNHMMQLLAVTAMEAPAGADAATINDAKFALFRSVRDADPAHYVRGRYDGYLDVPGVADGSTTETYMALRLEIDNWRWAGVPFFLRTGKCLPETQTEVRLVFKRPPRLGFVATDKHPPEPSQVVVRLDPSTGVRIVLDAQRAGETVPRPITLDMDFAEEGGEGATPYEVLLHDAMEGRRASFTREDSTEEKWRIMQPLLDAPGPVHPYAKGSWGPPEADRLLAGVGRWHEPWSGS